MRDAGGSDCAFGDLETLIRKNHAASAVPPANRNSKKAAESKAGHQFSDNS
jgi:hypothetical protein